MDKSQSVCLLSGHNIADEICAEMSCFFCLLEQDQRPPTSVDYSIQYKGTQLNEAVSPSAGRSPGINNLPAAVTPSSPSAPLLWRHVADRTFII